MESATDPHMAARGVWQEVDGVFQAAPAPRFSTRTQTTRRDIPARGAHTTSVLDWLKTD